ncbi:MAG: hypothetical protein ACBR50_01790 [Microcoleus sp.]
MIPQNPLLLLDKLSKHPRGLELAYLVYQLHQDSHRQTQPEPRLVAIALNLAKRQAIKEKDIPYFKAMANDEIRGWIAQHSPKQEIN